MSHNNDIQFSAWDDFEVVGHDGLVSAAEQYTSFLHFKKTVSKLPMNELVKRGWISSEDPTSSLLSFFKNIHKDRCGVLYRKSDSSNEVLISLWLSHLKSTSEIEYFIKKPPQFTGITKEDLRNIARMSPDVHSINKLPEILLDYGIILIYQKSFNGMKLDGVSFKLSTGTPVIGLSFRFKRLDYFWFTLMHELSHLSLHYELLDNPILDELDVDSDSPIEVAANRMAKAAFVDRHIWRNCTPKYDKSIGAINKFAHEVNIHPAIIAGLLRKESGDFKAYSTIVNDFNVREEVFGND